MKLPRGLIVSCQAREDNPLHGPHFMAAMALAAAEKITVPSFERRLQPENANGGRQPDHVQQRHREHAGTS